MTLLESIKLTCTAAEAHANGHEHATVILGAVRKVRVWMTAAQTRGGVEKADIYERQVELAVKERWGKPNAAFTKKR